MVNLALSSSFPTLPDLFQTGLAETIRIRNRNDATHDVSRNVERPSIHLANAAGFRSRLGQVRRLAVSRTIQLIIAFVGITEGN